MEEEEEFEEVADLFESSYNFRFEEPCVLIVISPKLPTNQCLPHRGADEIARYPRNISSTVRREESHRKEVRERRKERKEQEKLQKKEEVKRLKSLKMKEIREKLERVGKEGGKKVDETEGESDTRRLFAHVLYMLLLYSALQDLDLEGDWDPDAHDAQMSKIYGQDDEGELAPDIEKPTWDDDIDIADIAASEDGSSETKNRKKKKKKKGKEEVAQDEGVDVEEMDADVQKDFDDEEWDGTEESRKRKLDEYMDELYGLEFNDMASTRCVRNQSITDHELAGRRYANALQLRESAASSIRPHARRDPPGHRRRA